MSAILSEPQCVKLVMSVPIAILPVIVHGSCPHQEVREHEPRFMQEADQLPCWHDRLPMGWMETQTQADLVESTAER